MKIALIVAAARNHVIGRNNQLPWHLPEDLKHFKKVTLGKPIIMGRKTYESIGKPLPGRANIVVTNQCGWSAGGILVANGVPAAIELARSLGAESGAEELMIIGGAQIYRESLPLAQRIYMTRIDADVEGDTFFPPLLPGEWQKVGAAAGESGATLPYEFQIWERVTQ